MSRIVVLIAATWCFFACLAETPAEVFNQILDCESDFDSAEDFAESTGVSFSTRYSQEISTSGLEEDQFLASFRSHCTNLAFSVAGDPLDDSWRRFNAALDVLSRCDTNHFPILLSDLITNCPSALAVQRASFEFCRTSLLSKSAMALYTSDAVKTLPRTRRCSAYRGLFSCQCCLDVDSCASNRAFSVAMMAQNAAWDDWGYLDDMMCRFWADYITSSNRYLAAISARDSIPPPTSTNYLNRVISELEALPPGTMQMLSTNHLGAAWNEN